MPKRQRRLRPGRPLPTTMEERFTWDPEAVTPADKREIYPFFALGVILAFVALIVCYRKQYMLLYGDAVAHLGIARRIVDAHYPGLAQLGGVWLPLPHLLMLPFIKSMAMWQTGFAALPMSIASYALSVTGVWRLARSLVRPRWAFVATAFYALNPNLLYLSTTAMTETLFLALFIWTVVVTMEAIAAMRAGKPSTANARMIVAGLLIVGQVFTRYDGWIIGAVVWLVLAIAWWRSPQRAKMQTSFIVFTLLCVAGPLVWFWYNAHFEHDWLDFMRGPYSAKAIERKTAPPGQHYRGWHNPAWALLFYLRTAQVDAAAWETGFGLLIASLYGLYVSARRRAVQAVSLRGETAAALLWVPLPFYIYSIAYGSVPIFIPQLWPHSYYNARYGMELLPALAIYAALAGESFELWFRAPGTTVRILAARFIQPIALVLCAGNCLWMMYKIPSVLKEGIVNASTRVPFERSLASVLIGFGPDVPVMMSTSAHIGAVQTAGRNLTSMVSENDEVSWEKGLADPAHNAQFVIAMKGDPVEAAVKAHPEGLKELEVICTSGQPCATVYQSELYAAPTR
ncbi:hypothetical protein ACFQBQ_16975 [Granulicella cerasi]|uniref:Glycosyltransferase RgtA/B/C/D-like domain-containing protein n=1 Tax=Granulicella cerasi TaxID=741063 RepID=A0ABW1ZEU6_9BACT|nr:hypothetical protein [Granulicella cerasi]